MRNTDDSFQFKFTGVLSTFGVQKNFTPAFRDNFTDENIVTVKGETVIRSLLGLK